MSNGIQERRNHVVLGTGDGNRQVLILFVETVKQSQLLLSMSRVVEGIEIECDVGRRCLKGLNKQIDQDIAQPPEIGDRDGVFQSR